MTMATIVAGKTPRTLSCVSCQQRKIKCDRVFPCSNCKKAGAAAGCKPSTPAPARKRRRPNQDLQQRLARCEELLQEYAGTKPSETSPKADDLEQRWQPGGKLIVDDGGERFTDSSLWATVHDEVRAMREIVDDDEKDEESTSATPADGQTPDHHAGLLLSDGSDSNLGDLHPESAHVFRLWQTFLERINPLTKVVHVPTVQPLVAEAAANPENLPKNIVALLFSIYTISVVAMSELECTTLLGMTKDRAFARFSKGARVALMRVGILHKYDLVVLQAMVLYLTSLAGRYDRHAAWILNGVIVRIAQKMGLHRDGETLGLSTFTTEIRRRVWWQIILLDTTYALMSGLGQSMLPRRWDTKEPRNVSDADLFPEMTKIEPKEGPTDMVLCLMNYEIAKFLVDIRGLDTIMMHNEVEIAESPNQAELDTARQRVGELDTALGEILRRYSDPSMGPVHELASLHRPVIVAKLYDMLRPIQEQPEWGAEILTPKDNLFKFALVTSEQAVQLYDHSEKSGAFIWFMMTHFQVEVFLFMIGQLCTRTEGTLVDRAWVVVERLYHYHTELFNLGIKPNGPLAVFMLRAWKKRAEVLRARTGIPPTIPWHVSRLQELLGSNTALRDAVDVKTTTTPIQSMGMEGFPNPVDVDITWDQMLGFMGQGSPDWDMFGTAAPNAVNSFSAPAQGQAAWQYQNMNGWL